MDRQWRRRRSIAALTGLVVASAMLAACSTSSSSSGTTSTTTVVGSPSYCTLLSPADVQAVTGATVGSPRTVHQGPVTDCTYASANPSDAVLIRYTTGASSASFATEQSAFEKLGHTVTPVSGLGDEAYSFSESVGATTKNTVTARQGTVQVTVTGSATPAQVEELARQALARAT